MEDRWLRRGDPVRCVPQPACHMIEDDGLPFDIGEMTLRRVEYEDAADIFEIYSNPDVARLFYGYP